MTLARRSFLTGLSAIIAAPAIVRASSLMPVKALKSGWDYERYVWTDTSLGYAITREAIEDNLYRNVFSRYAAPWESDLRPLGLARLGI